MKVFRRRLITLVAGLVFAGALAGASLAIDINSLNEPPASGEMALGATDAKVTIIEYASASCSHCAEFHKGTFSILKKDYIDQGKIRFVFREFPHNQAGLAAFMIARCAPKEKYFALLDAIFETQDSWLNKPAEGLFKVARFAGFTKDSFEACVKNKEVADGIMAVRKKAAKEFGVRHTPTLFINGEMLSGEVDIDKIKTIIDPILSE